jgi:hypothetical protein
MEIDAAGDIYVTGIGIDFIVKATNYNIVQASALPRQFLLSLSFVVAALFIASSVRAGVCNESRYLHRDRP